MRTVIAFAWMMSVAVVTARTTKEDPVTGFWRSNQITEFKSDGTVGIIQPSGENLTTWKRGRWTVIVTEKKVRIYQITWEDGKSDNIQMMAPYDMLVYGAGSSPGVYGKRVRHLKTFFWSNGAVHISWVNGAKESKDFPQYLTMNLFVRKGDTLGISLRNLNGKITFGLEGIENGRSVLKASDFRYSKRFDSRWLETPDLTGYQEPDTVFPKDLKLGDIRNPSAAQPQEEDLNTKTLYYKYVFR